MIEFFKRNKKVLIISLILFLVCAIGAGIYSYCSVGDDYGSISNAFYQKANNGTINQTNDLTYNSDTIGLLLHNIIADFILIACGFLFSIFSILIAIFNSVTIGIPFGADLTYSMVTIFPHGIFEYTALVFALACAFNITKLEIKIIKNRSFRNTLMDHKRELKDILIMCGIVFILLVIAAIIECNIVPYFAHWYYGV